MLFLCCVPHGQHEGDGVQVLPGDVHGGVILGPTVIVQRPATIADHLPQSGLEHLVMDLAAVAEGAADHRLEPFGDLPIPFVADDVVGVVDQQVTWRIHAGLGEESRVPVQRPDQMPELVAAELQEVGERVLAVPVTRLFGELGVQVGCL